jgi:hypothetical protein
MAMYKIPSIYRIVATLTEDPCALRAMLCLRANGVLSPPAYTIAGMFSFIDTDVVSVR